MGGIRVVYILADDTQAAGIQVDGTLEGDTQAGAQSVAYYIREVCRRGDEVPVGDKPADTGVADGAVQ